MSEERPLPDDREQPPAEPLARWGLARRGVEPRHLFPIIPRRHSPSLIVEPDGSAAAHNALVWALREAARRDGTVIAVGVVDEDGDAPVPTRPGRHDAAVVRERVEAQVLRAIAETGVHGRVRTAVLDRALFDALIAASHGADLVVVGPDSKTLLRPAVPRRLARGA